MTDGEAYRQFCKTAEKWRDLAERRRAWFIELYQSGRWKLYYTEAQFILRMREVAGIAETWNEIAPPSSPAAASQQQAPATGNPRRAA
jgi:uncharacterized repeat protein (TIGR03809 family)